ncbi:SP_0009 family protein [Streptococcus sciuri]|uniref:SP_0009 family protein n=1 Tax=Streptococcus sciuri TaxID=2973939 RepID=A0ABT2F690_9STRE|nr:SP_0009 family protein [Streptococcus sciuri]MCS4487983.1 SP_0009 family protein [Streptococcus sciuri]
MEKIVTIIERFLEYSDIKLEELSQTNQELLETFYSKEEKR